MARLPQPGNDQGVWGDVLNDFLSQGHKSDGTLKNDSVTSAAIADGAVTTTKLGTSSSPTTGQALTYGGSGLAWTTLSASGSVPDADSSTKGLIQLTGQLGGTASSPTVPGLAAKENTITAGTTTQYYRGDKSWQTLNATAVGLGNVNNTADSAKPISSLTQTALNAKADDSAVVHLSGSETITGVKNFTGTLQAGGQAVVATNDSRLSDQRIPTNTSVTVAKLSAANSPSNGQILSYNGTTFNWVAAPTGGSDPVMGGDMSGTASNAQIVSGAVGATELATNAVTTIKITDSNVTTAKIADDAVTEPKLAVSNSPSNNQVLTYVGSALTWTTPSGGGGSSTTVTTTKTANYTAANHEYVKVNSSAGGFTVTLPAATNGAWVTIKKVDTSSNAVLLVPSGGATIEDNGNYAGLSVSINTAHMAVDVICDGTNWLRVG